MARPAALPPQRRRAPAEPRWESRAHSSAQLRPAAPQPGSFARRDTTGRLCEQSRRPPKRALRGGTSCSNRRLRPNQSGRGRYRHPVRGTECRTRQPCRASLSSSAPTRPSPASPARQLSASRGRPDSQIVAHRLTRGGSPSPAETSTPQKW